MDSGRFELLRTGSSKYFSSEGQGYSWAGVVGDWGIFELAYPAERSSGAAGVYFRAVVAGPQIEESSFFGLLYGGRPTLTDGELTVAGQMGEIMRNSWGLSRQSRALRINVLGRRYRYSQVGGKRQHELRRDGVAVRMKRASWHIPKVLWGEFSGATDATDISLAILLEAVNTRNLSVMGALVSAPGRGLSRLAN